MKVVNLCIALVLCCILQTKSQNFRDAVKIRNYRSDLALGIDTRGNTNYVLSEFGKKESIVGHLDIRYFYQAQEYDQDLGLFLFPSRIYSAIDKSFFQPDPKSQYYSPYCFVGNDPVNIIDKDGNAGKPLVLYEQQFQKKASGISTTTEDLLDHFSDAYTMPLSDFMNNKIPPMPEWNGKVFVCAHMGISQDAEMEVERTLPGKKFVAKSSMLEYSAESEKVPFKIARISGENFGRKLRAFASKTRSVKSVFAGGCRGGAAARSIAMGYSLGGTGLPEGKEIKVFGLKTKYTGAYVGPKASAAYGEYAATDKLRFLALPDGGRFFAEKDMIRSVMSDDGPVYKQRVRVGHKETDAVYAEGEEVAEMMDNKFGFEMSRVVERVTMPY